MLVSEETNNRIFIENLERENMKSHQHIQALEARLEEMQDLLLVKIKELEAFRETSISLRNELQSLKGMMEKEEKQQNAYQLSLQKKLSKQSGADLHESPTSFKPSRFSKSADILWDKEEKNSAAPVGHSELPKRPASMPTSLNRDLLKAKSGQTQVYVNTLFKQSKKDLREKKYKRKESPVRTDSRYNTVISSAIGNMKIAEVDQSGYCVRLLNTSEKEEDIGEYVLQQNVGGHPTNKYRFPPKIRVKAQTTVTVWAAKANMFHNPPTEFVWKEQNMFGTGTEYTTILCKPNGHAIAWYTPMHWNTSADWNQYDIANEITDETKELSLQELHTLIDETETITEQHEPEASSSSFLKTEYELFSEGEDVFDWHTPTQWSKSEVLDDYPSLAKMIQSSMQINEEEDKIIREPKPDVCRTMKMKPKSDILIPEDSSSVSHMEEKVPVLLQREKRSSVVLPPTFSPWAQSPASPTHPHYSLSRSLPMGNDSSSFCRQARTQSTSDPEQDNLYAGCQSGKSSRGLIRSARDTKGALKICLPGSFLPLYEQHRRGLELLHSVQNLSFQPPMPKPPPHSSW